MKPQNVEQKTVLCGHHGQNGHNVQLLVVEVFKNVSEIVYYQKIKDQMTLVVMVIPGK